jgi:hypothetical protein
MPRAALVDHKATVDEVVAHAAAIRRLATELSLRDLRIRNDGTLVVHSEETGYRSVTRLSSAASELLGTYVHVITDDVPGASAAQGL